MESARSVLSTHVGAVVVVVAHLTYRGSGGGSLILMYERVRLLELSHFPYFTVVACNGRVVV